MAFLDFLTPAIASFIMFMGALVVAAIGLAVVGRYAAARAGAQGAQLGLERAKLALVQRRQELEDLERASHVLTDDEKQRLDALREDLAVLSRRNLALKAEVESRLVRLERAVENAKMAGQMDEIRERETRLMTLGRMS